MPSPPPNRSGGRSTITTPKSLMALVSLVSFSFFLLSVVFSGLDRYVAAREDTLAKPWERWDQNKLEKWIDEHGIANPGNLNPTQLKHIVSENYENPPYKTWSDSQLLSWFTEHDLLAPTSSSSSSSSSWSPFSGSSSSSSSSSWGPRTTNWGEWGPTSWFEREEEEGKGREWRERMERAVGRSWEDGVERWEESDLKEWLEDHGIITPPKSTTEQLRDHAAAFFPTVQDHLTLHRSKSPTERAAANTKQAVFSAYNKVPSSEEVSDRLLSTWTDSQLRDYLLERGYVAPSGKREELVVEARKAVKNERERMVRLREIARERAEAAGEWGGETWYSAVENGRLGYDWVRDRVGEGGGYVWSAWSESQLRNWLESHGIVEPQSTTAQLRERVKDIYSESSQNVYDTWNDNALRSWLEQHGVIRTKQAKTRDELLDLMARNYYSARDTTWHWWSTNQIRRWLESRGLVKSEEQKSREELINLMEENYFTLRDAPYQAWDRSMTKKYLAKKGVIDERNRFEVTRDEALKMLGEYYHGANDYIWDTWSTAQQRAWLVKEGVLDQADAANKKREDLEKLLADNYHSGWETIEATWKDSDMRQWLIDNGWMKSDYESKRDEILDMFKKNYKATSKKANEYTSWSDNRLRGWLRDHGVQVPMNSKRDELLQQMKENYVASQGVFQNVKDWISGNTQAAHDKAANKIDRDLTAAESAASKSASSAASSASSVASKAAQSAKASADKAKQEL